MIHLEEKNIKIIKISSKKTDSIFISITVALLFLFSFLLYKDLYQSYKGSGEPVGKIIFKKKVALRKLQNQSIWEYLQNEYPVYNGDSIRTEELSEAVLRLKDGTEIAINENSFIIINLVGEEAKIDFNYGSLQANTENQNLKIKTKDSEIVLSSANAKLINKNESIQIQLEKGEANLKTKGKEEKIKENEVAILSKESNELKKEKISLKLLLPEDNSKFYAANAININFSIEGDVNEQYELLLSSNPNFAPILKKIPIKNQISLNLDPGSYFWKVISKDSKTQIGFYRKFTIYKKEKIQLQLPTNNEIFSFKENSNINFSWSASENVNSYEVWIDTNSNFSNPKKITTLTNFISIPFELNQQKTEYFWKVIPKTELKEAVLESNTYSFTIQKIEKEKPAILITPLNETFFQQDLQKGISFSWKIPNSKDQIFQISKDKNFEQIVYEEKLSNNFFILKKPLEPALYYWRILNIDKVESNVGSFLITDKIEIQIVHPTKNQILFPKAGVEVNFNWKVPNFPFNFKIIFSKNPDFKNPLQILDTTQNSISLNIQKLFLNQEGVIYWKVIAIDKNKNKEVAESISSFKIYNLPEKPKFLQPFPNQTFDITQINKIIFQWTKTKFTDYYEFEILKQDQTIEKFNLKTNVLEYDPFKKLNIGKFRGKIQSIREVEKEILKSEETTIDFFIEQKINKKPEFLTPEKIFVE